MQVDYAHLYCLRDASKPGTLHFHWISDVDDVALLTAAFVPSRPLELRQSEDYGGDKKRDLVATTYAGLYLLSDRVVHALDEAKVTGLATYPVHLLSLQGERITGYQGLAIRGRCGPPDDSRSRIVRLPPHVPTGKGREVYEGLYFDETTWDGSDFFVPAGTLYKIVTQRVRDVLDAIQATNVKMVPLTEVQAPIL